MNNETIKTVALGELRPHPANREIEEADVQSLAASIRVHGIIEPLITRPMPDGKEQVLGGHRRLLAASIVGLSHVRVLSCERTDKEALEIVLIPNLERDNLDPMEEHAAVTALVSGGWEPDEIARRIARSAEWVQLRLSLGDLPCEMRDAVRARSVSVDAAAKVLLVPQFLREEAAAEVLHPSFQELPLTARQAHDVLMQKYILPAKRAAEWASAKPRLLKKWKAAAEKLCPGCKVELKYGEPDFAWSPAWVSAECEKTLPGGETTNYAAIASGLGAPLHVFPAKDDEARIKASEFSGSLWVARADIAGVLAKIDDDCRAADGGTCTPEARRPEPGEWIEPARDDEDQAAADAFDALDGWMQEMHRECFEIIDCDDPDDLVRRRARLVADALIHLRAYGAGLLPAPPLALVAVFEAIASEGGAQ